MSCCGVRTSSGVTAIADIIAIVGGTGLGGIKIQSYHACVPSRIFIIIILKFFVEDDDRWNVVYEAPPARYTFFTS